MGISLGAEQCRVLHLCCDEALEVGPERAVDVQGLLKKAAALGIPQQELYDTLARLVRIECIRPYSYHAGRLRHFVILWANVTEYQGILEQYEHYTIQPPLNMAPAY